MVAVKRKPAISRTQKNAAIAAVFFFLLPIVIIVDHKYGHGARQAIERATYTSADRQAYHGRMFAVLRVIDGDTIEIAAPDGDRDTTLVRLIGVDTPETKHPTVEPMYYGQEATAYTESIVTGQLVTILLDSVGDERDRYGRLLAYVVLPDGRFLNAELIRAGYGYAYLNFQHSHFDEYCQLMEKAIQSRDGLWGTACRDDLPKWLQSKRPDLLRYP